MDNLGKIDTKHIASPSDHIIDLSISLLGEFRKGDFTYQINKNGQLNGFLDEWDFKTEPDAPQIKKDFDHYFDFECWSLIPEIVSGKSFSFSTGQGKTQTNYTVHCKFLHTPTTSNYWHFSVRWLMNGNDVYNLRETGGISASQISRLSKIARTFLKEYVTLNIPLDTELNEEIYLKKKVV